MSDSIVICFDEVARSQPTYGKRVQTVLSRMREKGCDRDDMMQFLAFAVGMAPRSKAQLFQDLWALWRADRRRDGYFVEVGAADGLHLSNTHFLETEMGWAGVVAEPNPRFHDRLAANRRCFISTKCVYSRSGETLEFLAAPLGEFSRIASIEPGDSHEETRRGQAQRIAVDTISLNDLLTEAEAPRHIDYLSIDTEGSELEILSALDFERWTIDAITVEHNFTPLRAKLHELLTAKGYRRQWKELSFFDDWYVRR